MFGPRTLIERSRGGAAVRLDWKGKKWCQAGEEQSDIKSLSANSVRSTLSNWERNITISQLLAFFTKKKWNSGLSARIDSSFFSQPQQTIWTWTYNICLFLKSIRCTDESKRPPNFLWPIGPLFAAFGPNALQTDLHEWWVVSISPHCAAVFFQPEHDAEHRTPSSCVWLGLSYTFDRVN